MQSKNKEILVMGFALFAMFFGAGNVIFPPYIGIMTGSDWFKALLGFTITGMGMPLLGLLATFRAVRGQSQHALRQGIQFCHPPVHRADVRHPPDRGDDLRDWNPSLPGSRSRQPHHGDLVGGDHRFRPLLRRHALFLTQSI